MFLIEYALVLLLWLVCVLLLDLFFILLRAFLLLHEIFSFYRWSSSSYSQEVVCSPILITDRLLLDVVCSSLSQGRSRQRDSVSTCLTGHPACRTLYNSCIVLSFKWNCRCSSSLLYQLSAHDYVMSLSLLPSWKIFVSYIYIYTSDVVVRLLLLDLSYCIVDGRHPRLNQICVDLNWRRFRLRHLKILLLLMSICDGAVISTTNSCDPELITVCRKIWH